MYKISETYLVKADLSKYKTPQDVYKEYPELKVMKLQELVLKLYDSADEKDYHLATAIKSLMALEKDKLKTYLNDHKR
jgi:hypothetical protein